MGPQVREGLLLPELGGVSLRQAGPHAASECAVVRLPAGLLERFRVRKARARFAVCCCKQGQAHLDDLVAAPRLATLPSNAFVRVRSRVNQATSLSPVVELDLVGGIPICCERVCGSDGVRWRFMPCGGGGGWWREQWPVDGSCRVRTCQLAIPPPCTTDPQSRHASNHIRARWPAVRRVQE